MVSRGEIHHKERSEYLCYATDIQKYQQENISISKHSLADIAILKPLIL